MNAARLARRWDEAGDNRLIMAEALADEMAADLVTKADLGAAVQELRAEMHGLHASLVKWVAGMLVIHAFGVAGMTVTLIRLLA